MYYFKFSLLEVSINILSRWAPDCVSLAFLAVLSLFKLLYKSAYKVDPSLRLCQNPLFFLPFLQFVAAYCYAWVQALKRVLPFPETNRFSSFGSDHPGLTSRVFKPGPGLNSLTHVSACELVVVVDDHLEACAVLTTSDCARLMKWRLWR